MHTLKRNWLAVLSLVAALPAAGQALSPEAVAIADLLRVLLKASAARFRVAPKLIADSSDLDRIACEDDPDVMALKGWRRELFGEEALRVKRGEVAVIVQDGAITTVPRT